MTEPAPAAFDALAAGYDARTGLLPGVGEAVAESIIAITGAGEQDLLLELGAGTGEIGASLAQAPVRYLGLDSSPAMLERFRERVAPLQPDLRLADANAPWPVPDASVAAIVAVRVIHLLHPDHVVREAQRVVQPGGLLLLGHVRRDRDSLKERLRRRRQQALRDAGLPPRQVDAGVRDVLARCVAAGGEDLGARLVVEWTRAASAAAIFAEWEGMDRMGGHALDATTQARVLAEVRAWAEAEFGDLDRVERCPEMFTLEVIRLPGTGA
ncbi:MAG: class I SAM-dependent methyltransferase [Thermomicrobiales bacterium]